MGIKLDETKSQKFKKFVKRYIYYIATGLCVIALATIIAITSSSGKVIQSNETLPTNANAITFTNPVSTVKILKNYSDEELMFNKTLNQWEAHEAVDFLADSGSQVFSVALGKVSQIYTTYIDGTVIVIEHDGGFKSLYSSLEESTLVKVGDEVKAGQVIGKISNTNKSEAQDGAHLHFELYKNNIKVNPNDYLQLTEK
jgi:murein DD-endopeptidase MepM/ murein hydrolase activator NlpD